MPRLELASDKCLSVDIGNTRYEANGKGYVDVERPEHIAIAQQTALRFHGQSFSFKSAAGITCGICNFEQLLAFSAKPCPKCGTPFTEVQDGTEVTT